MPRLLRRTTHQINEQEANWSGFLVDPNAGNPRWLHNAPVVSTSQTGKGLLREAWSTCRTIVTSNGSEFLRYFEEFQNPPSKHECKDLWGLLVVSEELLKSGKHLLTMDDGLPILPKERLHWPAAGFLNLFIHLTDEGVSEIRRFRRCHFCEQSIDINYPWREWYKSLPLA